MDDLISRQAAIDALDKRFDSIPMEQTTEILLLRKDLRDLPPVQPERLTDDDFETIRIHLNAYKEELCNQRRWKEAGEYQRIIDRFLAFASAQPERIIRCKDCKHWIPYDWMFSEIWQSKNREDYLEDDIGCDCCDMAMKASDFCSRAERREVTT